MINLTIATGKSRTDVKWKNQETTWDKLCDRLKEPKRTAETVAEYKAMPKAQQGEIKDVGGFVGGRLNGDRRTSMNIDKRSLIVLDLDYAGPHALFDIDMLCDFAWAVYTTHTHTPEKPRYRLLVPTDREVAADEYEPVARWLANLIGIEQCDASTYDPVRLMYWPSTSADGEYIFQTGGFGPLNVGTVLASYPDWKNPIYWPTAEREARAEAKRMEKAEDPLTKPGTIGAFCRAYPISRVVDELLADVYERVDDGRYTYLPGSTVGGAKVYEDKWLYSHHGTDPVGGQLVNAFDLVRVHRYGVLDKDTPGDTKVNRLPSYDKMLEWAVELPEVLGELVEEKSAEIESDFGGIDWQTKLERRKDGSVAPTINNVAVIILNAAEFIGKIGDNLLTGQVEVRSAMPWDSPQLRYPRGWTDTDDACLRNHMESAYRIRGRELVYDGFAVAIAKRSFHPIRDYLDSLPEWDGVVRVEMLLTDYFGAEDTLVVRAMVRKTLVAAVARVMRPGCKFDNVLVLQGAQGIGKSTLWKKLAGAWFSDSLRSMDDNKAFESLRGIWIGELAELAATKKSEVEAQKAFLSSQVDRYRPAFGRRVLEFPRQCILVGTTNEHEFLRDRTGNRRFWIVKLGKGGKLDIFKLDQDTVDQVWAEAKHLYNLGEKLYLDREIESSITEINEEYAPENPWAGVIEDFLEKLVPISWSKMTKKDKREFVDGFYPQGGDLEPIQRVCAAEIADLALKILKPTKADFTDIRRIMLCLPGWKENSKKQKCGPDYGAQRCIERQPPLATSL